MLYTQLLHRLPFDVHKSGLPIFVVIVPMGIGKAKYVLVVVDECTRYSWVFPMRKKARTARLLALLIQRINKQTRRPGKPGVRRLHTHQGGEFKSTSLVNQDRCP